MSDLLIPIAVSSQLDVTGEERIHAAPYKTVTRSVYVAPPTPPTHPLLVAVGDGGKIYTSTALSGPWALSATGNPRDLLCVDFGNDVFVAVGNGSFMTNTVLSSEDGLTWVEEDFPVWLSAPGGCSFGNGVHVAIGETAEPLVFHRDADGVWAQHLDVPVGIGTPNRLTFAAGKFAFTTEDGNVVWSATGTGGWTSVAVNGYLCGITYNADDEEWMAVGENGEAFTAPVPAGPWSQVTSGHTYTFSDVGYHTRTGYFATVTNGGGGNQGIWTYDTGVWTQVEAIASPQFCYNGTVEDDVPYVGGDGEVSFNGSGVEWLQQDIAVGFLVMDMVIGDVPDA